MLKKEVKTQEQKTKDLEEVGFHLHQILCYFFFFFFFFFFFLRPATKSGKVICYNV